MSTSTAALTQYENILVDRHDAVAVVRLNRPKVLNALSPQLMAELTQAMAELDADPAIRAIVLTGSERAFAAGADIKEMADASLVEMVYRDMIGVWDRLRQVKKPLIAAVSGFALGGGCEVAMMCDFIVASETAVFGQPEINLGVIPGAGGTQRLTRLLGKSLAMDMILTGRNLKAPEALAHGLVSRVFPVESYLDEAIALAKDIASKGPMALRVAKEAVNKAFETSLTEGLEAERQRFYMLFATEDQKEGMRAFLDKRPPQFTGR